MFRLHTPIALLVAALALSACPASDEPAPAPEPPPAKNEVEQLLAEPPKVEMIPTAAVQAAFQGWLESQNGGDFDAYSATYAERFFGIKRSGPRTYRYARAGWLADRQRMFRKAFEVKADKVEIATSQSTATVSFVQTWSSGTYQDVGPKQLVFSKEGDGQLRIAREEMLSSKLLHESVATGGSGAARASFVQTLGDDHWVVLATNLEDDSWALGEPRHTSSSPAIARKRVDLAKLPPDLASFDGKKLRLYSEAGPVCTASVSDLAVVARFWPHFGMEGLWQDSEGPSDAEIAQEIWSMGPKTLMGKLKPGAAEQCDGALWARDASLRAPLVYTPDSTLAEALRPTVLPAFRELKGYETQQAAYEDEVEPRAAERWDSFDGATPTITAFTDAASDKTLIVADAMSGMGCGGFYGEFWAAWWVVRDAEGRPRLELLSDARTPGPHFRPVAATDLDGDGKPEFLSRTVLVETVDGKLGASVDAEMPSFDCPC